MQKHTELKRDFWFGMGSVVCSALLAISILLTVSPHSMAGISGRAFPWLIAVFLFMLGTALALDSFRKLKTLAPLPAQANKKTTVTKGQIVNISLYLGLVALYVLGITFLGYIASTALFVFFLLLFYRLKQRVAFILLVCLLPVLMWYLFHELIEVQFPDAWLM